MAIGFSLGFLQHLPPPSTWLQKHESRQRNIWLPAFCGRSLSCLALVLAEKPLFLVVCCLWKSSQPAISEAHMQTPNRIVPPRPQEEEGKRQAPPSS
jgi:hypothetical protein